MATTDKHEDVHNSRLADLLNSGNIMAEFQKKRLGGKIDVDVTIDGIVIALEGKNGWEESSRNKAIKDATGRLQTGKAKAGMGVCYPHGPTLTLQQGTEIIVCPVGSGGSWITTTPAELPELLTRMAQDVGDVDATASTVQKALGEMVDGLSLTQLKHIASFSNVTLKRKDQTEKNYQKLAVQTLLIIFSAAMFHARLDSHLASTRSPLFDAREYPKKIKFTGNWPPQKLLDCLLAPDPRMAITKSWHTILAKDYRPIFEAGLNIITGLNISETYSEIITSSTEAGLIAAGKLEGINHDLLGRLFHWSISSAKHDGSFYTSSSAAAVLATLAVRDSDAKNLADLRIIDPACGTGTLLVATADRICQLAGRNSARYKILVESALNGWDINQTAVHMAAVSLGIMSPLVSFDNMEIHMVPLGVYAGKAYAGSLELMQETNLQTMLLGKPVPKSKQLDQIDQESEGSLSGKEEYDIVIMNPPFTRDSLRYDHLSSIDEPKVKAREDELFKGKSSTRSHPGGMFLLLAKKLLGERGDTLAFLSPLTGATNPSTRQVWNELWDSFYLEYCVCSHDPLHYGFAFSENTKISEMLCVLRKKTTEENPPDAKIVKLSSNPPRSPAAYKIAESIIKGETDNFDGQITEWEQKKIASGDWSPVRFYSEYLVRCQSEWFSAKERGKPLFEPLEKAAIVGPAGQDIRGIFTLEETPHPNGYEGVWFNDQSAPPDRKRGKAADATKWHDAPTKVKMEVQPDGAIHPKPRKDARAAKVWTEAGTLLIPNKPRLSSFKTNGIRTETPTLGSAWVPVKKITALRSDKTENWEKAICVYLNSTLGILATFTQSDPHSLGRHRMSLAGQKKIPIPRLNEEQIVQLAETYDQIKDATLDRLRNPQCPIRKTLDEATTEVLNTPKITKHEVAKSRRHLAAEPGVTGKRYTGII